MILNDINKHEKDDYITLNEENHRYNVNGDLNYISTTTWVNMFFKKFDSEKIIDKMMESKNWSNSKYFGMKKNEIKKQWEENSLYAIKEGIKLHHDIEYYYNNIEVNNNSIEYSYFINFVKDHEKLVPYRTEWSIWDEELKICGTIDMVYQNNDGTFSIYDWKRTKEIKKINIWGETALEKCIEHIQDTNFWHYSIQLNIYKYLLEKNYEKKVKELYIVCFHPLHKNYKKYKIPNLTNEVANLFKIRIKELKHNI